MCNKILVKYVLNVSSNVWGGYYSSANRNFNFMFKRVPNLNYHPSTRNMCLLIQRKPLLSNGYSSSHHNSVIPINGLMLTGLPVLGFRSYCSNKEQDLPKIMNLPQVVWPSIFKTVRNWILANFIIMRYFDHEFNLPDFVAGSKQAVELVSGTISRGDLDSLSGLVTPDVITLVRDSMTTFSLKQRQEFAIKSNDIYFCFPYEVGVMFPNEDKNDGENQSRFVEITMCYHALRGLQELKDSGANLPVNLGMMPEYQDRLFICNYRFIREFTKGVQDDWTVNAINHFKPSTHV
uniref:Juvenile hormone esterase binding protein n=1 Tax=Cuerna arida TaxID=1464854 RepID=A0A1B6GAU0_9HEMI